jgi:hypothetical protein
MLAAGVVTLIDILILEGLHRVRHVDRLLPAQLALVNLAGWSEVAGTVVRLAVLRRRRDDAEGPAGDVEPLVPIRRECGAVVGGRLGIVVLGSAVEALVDQDPLRLPVADDLQTGVVRQVRCADVVATAVVVRGTGICLGDPQPVRDAELRLVGVLHFVLTTGQAGHLLLCGN